MTERIELLVWSGCPSHQEAHDRIAGLLTDLGRPDIGVEIRWIETHEEAVRAGFTGSPTFNWHGRDLLPQDPSTAYGLACRIYHRRDGRASPLPDAADLGDAVLRAIADDGARALGPR